MGLVKLKTSNFQNNKESFSEGVRKTKDQGVLPDNNKKDIENDANDANDEVNNSANDANDEVNNSALVSVKWYVNKVNIPIIVFAITSLYYILTIVPGTQADELYHRFSGQYEELLSKKLNKLSNDNQNLNVKTKIGNIRRIGNREIGNLRKNKSDDSNIENDIQLINQEMDIKIDKLNEENIPIFNDIQNYREKLKNIKRIDNDKLTEEHKIYIKYERYKGMKRRLRDFDSVKDFYNTIFNPLANISRKVVDPPSKYDLMGNKIIHRIIENNGLINNIVFEFLDWYNEGPIFYTLMWQCSVALFIPIYIQNLQVIQPQILRIVNRFIKTPNRRRIIEFLSMFLIILVIIAWAFITPLLFIMCLLSVYFLWLWAIPIIIYHYKDLLCEVERGGYKRKPLLLPVSKVICKGFNKLMNVGVLKEFQVECENEREVLKKICKAVEIIWEILWIIIVTPILYLIQSQLLSIAIMLKIISIVNVVTFSYYMAKKANEDGPVFTLPQGPDILGGVWWEETRISLRMPWMKSATNKWWLPISKYIKPEEWSLSVMEAVDWITCLDPNTWVLQLATFIFPTNLISKIFDIDPLVKLKKPTKCEPRAWQWDPNALNRAIKLPPPPGTIKSSFMMGKYRRLREGEEPKAYGRF